MTFYEMIKLIHEGENRPFGRGYYHPRDGASYYEKVLNSNEDEQVMLTNADIFATDWEICEDDVRDETDDVFKIERSF